MKDVKLSIIVPVYNTEAYLPRCIESLLHLRVINLEIILIDDGATDSSGEICDRYALEHDFIKVVHKKNGGAMSARNLGIKYANGKFIAFVDSDDWVGEDIYTEFISAMDNDDELDVCIGGLKKVFTDGFESPVCKIYPAVVMDNMEAMEEMLQWKKFRWELCGNIYRDILFRDYNPPDTVSVGEDLVSNFYLLRNARKVLYQPIYQYFYFTNLESVTESNKYPIKNLMKSFYYVNGLGINNKQINILIGELYAKEIIKDIFFKIFLEEKFIEYIPLYRQELRRLMDIKEVYGFMCRHFEIEGFQKGLDDDKSFYEFWNTMAKGITGKLYANTIPYKKVYIYGTGVVSRFIVQILQKYKIRFDSFVISDGQKKKNEEVKYLSEIKDENIHTVFILALAAVFHDEIRNNLRKRGYTNLLAVDSISDMYR